MSRYVMELKKFRIRTPEGNYEVIEASNAEAALTYAKHKFGKLPNEINRSIVESEMKVFFEVREAMNTAESNIREAAREADWERVYQETKNLVESLTAAGCVLLSKSGSLIKSIN